MEGTASNHADVEISKADGDEAAPSKEHVAFVQEADDAPGGVARGAEGRTGETVELASCEMTKRMAREGVERKQGDIQG